MKTKERIIHVSLSLFNELGEPNVTTVDISNEMDISPGNLYYHYRNKDEIVEQIFAVYDAQLQSLIKTQTAIEDLVEYWLFVKLLLEKNWQFRFIFRDLYNMNSKYKNLHRKLLRVFNTLDKNLDQLNRRVCHHKIDDLDANHNNFGLTTHLMTHTLITWPQFQHLRNDQITVEDLMSQSAFASFQPLFEHLDDEQKAIVHELALGY